MAAPARVQRMVWIFSRSVPRVRAVDLVSARDFLAQELLDGGDNAMDVIVGDLGDAVGAGGAAEGVVVELGDLVGEPADGVVEVAFPAPARLDLLLELPPGAAPWTGGK